jgi:hypothetical protein
MTKKTTIFVPGRLCLLGEHTNWAAIAAEDSLERLKVTVLLSLQSGPDCRARSGYSLHRGKANSFFMWQNGPSSSIQKEAITYDI